MRKAGYYWVRLAERHVQGVWQVAEYRAAWWLIGRSTPLSEVEIEKVGPWFGMPEGLPA